MEHFGTLLDNCRKWAITGKIRQFQKNLIVKVDTLGQFFVQVLDNSRKVWTLLDWFCKSACSSKLCHLLIRSCSALFIILEVSISEKLSFTISHFLLPPSTNNRIHSIFEFQFGHNHEAIATDKSLSEAFILTSANPQYDKRFSLIYQFRNWKLQAHNMLCTQIGFCFCFYIQNNLCTHVLNW